MRGGCLVVRREEGYHQRWPWKESTEQICTWPVTIRQQSGEAGLGGGRYICLVCGCLIVTACLKGSNLESGKI